MSLDTHLHEAEPSQSPVGLAPPRDVAGELRPPRSSILSSPVAAGLAVGAAAAMTSLLCNVIGSVLVGLHPLHLTRVYLTFFAGEGALDQPYIRGEALTLSVAGCVLYLLAGMGVGLLFYLAVYQWLPRPTFLRRFAAVTVMSLALWVVNFYGVLSWLQPLIWGGDWIVRLIPWWVAAATHLAFGWTVLLIPALASVRYCPGKGDLPWRP